MGTVRIDQWPQTFETKGQRILDAALDAGVPFPHGCGTGECGSCKCQVLSGEVTMEKHSPLALTPEEREEGKILACRSKADGDIALRWLNNPSIIYPVLKFKSRVLSASKVAHDVVAVEVAVPEGVCFEYHPGQFAKLRFPGLPARSYSMATARAEGKLSFHMRIVPNGQVSQFVASALEPGETVEVQGPFGEAHWEPHHASEGGPLLLLGGGTGLAPMLSVLEAALMQGVPGEQIHLYHGVRGQRDLYAYEYLKKIVETRGITFVPVLSDDGFCDIPARAGMLHEAVAEDHADLSGASVFVAGPPPMVEAAKSLAKSRGAVDERVRADPFFAAENQKRSIWARLTGW
ncbi:2Fe-2S iron-sulfur cluster-binding protein [Hydrogenophaga sp. 5NK40-0174]|uniref:2Fe-2S iron-sulfur cluster-binding protein n=1 Tax=Hydrogenophaga sp. 5NK40-0174 TaxID=3127649 RepID=UPI0031064F31